MLGLSGGGRLLASPLMHYALVNALAAAATFLLVPVLLRLFDVEEFGRWALIEPVLFFGTILVLGGVEHGAMKQIAYDGEDLRSVAGELATSGAPLLLAGAALVSFAATPLVGQTGLLTLGAIIAIEGLIVLLLAAARAAGRIGAFAIGHIGRTALVLAVALALHLDDPSRRWTVEGFLLLRVTVAAAVLVTLIALLRPKPRYSAARYRDALVYGAFILATSLLNMLMDVMDRYILARNSDIALVAAYTVHVKLASLVGQGVVMPFSLWFAAERLRHFNDEDGGAAFFNRVAIWLLIVSCFLIGTTLLAADVILSLMAPGIALDPPTLACLLAAAAAIGMSYALNIGLLKPGRTHLNLAGILVGLGVTAAASLALVDHLGPLGVAAAKLAGTICFAGTLAMLSFREHPVKFRFGTMLLIILATCAFIAAAGAATPWTGYLGAGLRVALFTVLTAAALRAILSSQRLRRTL